MFTSLKFDKRGERPHHRCFHVQIKGSFTRREGLDTQGDLAHNMSVVIEIACEAPTVLMVIALYYDGPSGVCLTKVSLEQLLYCLT
jgi:hypothetical protein